MLRGIRTRVLQPVDRALFHPDSLPDGLVAAVALAPPVIAGVALFGVHAAVILGVALGAGLAAHLLMALIRMRASALPIPAAIVGVALAGPAAQLHWVVAAAVLAVAFELLRARIMPMAGIQVGLVAYGAVYMVSGGTLAAYVEPGTGAALADPIHQWLQSGSGAAAIDPTRLYVGDVAGPVFATSLLATAVGAAWAWYARRVSLFVLLGFAAGALAPILLMHWPLAVSLDSGPLWFLAALVLAQRDSTPSNPVGAVLLGAVGGLAVLGVRELQMGIEVAAMALPVLQLVSFLARVVAWMATKGRKRPSTPRLSSGRRTPPLPAGRRQPLPAPQSVPRPGQGRY